MKVVLLCAGQGSRLRPMTNDRPKGMVEVGGKPILERQLELFRSMGIDDIVVVGGYRHDAIPDYGITKRINAQYESTNMVFSLFTAQQDMADADDVIVSYADILYSKSVLQALVAATNSANVVVDLDWYSYFSQRSDDVLSDAETLQMADGLITHIGAKATHVDQIEAQYIGLMKFDRKAIHALTEIFLSSLADGGVIGWGRPAKTAYMTDLIQEFINQGNPVNAIPIEGGWCEIDTPFDFSLAEAMLPELTDQG